MKTRQGYTLVEVVVSMLLCAVMVTSVFTVALSGKSGGQKIDEKLYETQASQAVLQILANYVTADPSITQALVPGPNKTNCACTNDPPNCGCMLSTWYLDTVGGSFADSMGPVWALKQGHHEIRGSIGLVPQLRDAPYNAYVSYDVTGSNDQPNVTVTVHCPGCISPQP